MNLEYVNCDLCKSDNWTERYRKPDSYLWSNEYEFPVVACDSCGLVYVNPRPTFDEMRGFYPTDYHEERDDEAHQARYDDQFDYLKGINARTFLDIGCARGDWLNYLQGKFPDAELFGVDAFSDHVSNAAIHFERCQLTETTLPEQYFDVITAWAVFEHVHTPNAYFGAVARLLSPGGKFVFLVTNSESIYGKYAYKEDIPRHLYHFSRQSLSKYAEKNGLKLESFQCDERFWDGTGRGAVRFFVVKMLGITWRQIRMKKYSPLQKAMLFAAFVLDLIVFTPRWEKAINRSGIIVVTMSKK